MPSARITLKEVNGRKFTLVESAADAGTAQTRLENRVALTVGTVVPGTYTVSEDGGAAPTPATGTYSDFTIVAVDGAGETKVLNLENLTNAIANGTTGSVITPAPTALATYLGSKGLTFVSGKARR